ncbi:hypothetical protein HJ588_13810 [Flexivirga sp. ID2601S]|uniref:Uncharacterized protein n=1 Tax=Flexivirga aerilata TaxID=1656889 RepID=A0A849ALV3_9MICO|nr:hypothetical protein [Flexivirga aerilata]NNG40341.1 hypothetical protein [Flexivirga aerilata]
MTTLHSARGRMSSGPTRSAGRAQRILAIGAALLALPYFMLKVVWLSGSRIGIQDPDFGRSAVMHALNGATLGLDLAVLGLATVFYRNARPRSLLVVPPMWIGYGLLGQILLLIVPATLLQPTTSASAGPDAIAGWVYAVVYTGFCGIGLCLLPAFALYARDRWGRDWSRPLKSVAPQPVPAFTTSVAVLVALALAGYGLTRGDLRDGVPWLTDAGLGALAVLALLALSRGMTALPRWSALLVLFAGSGAWVAWGVYGLVLELVPNDLTSGPSSAAPVILNAAKVAGGLALARTIRRHA